MSLTLSNRIEFPIGKRRMVIADLAFDDSYPAGGESLPLRVLGLEKVDSMVINPKNGYQLEHDLTNNKIKVLSGAPAIVYEEKHTAVAGVITLDYPAAWIVCVTQAGQNMAWGKIQATGDLSGNTFCLSSAITDGTRTGITVDDNTDTLFVTYVTQAWADIYALLVQDEVLTLTTGAVDLDNALMGFGFVEAASSGILLPLDDNDTPAAGEVGINMGASTGAYEIESTENLQAAVTTYLKTATSGTLIADRFIDNEDPTKAGADPYTQAFDFPLLLWLISGHLLVDGGATQVIIDLATTVAAGEARINWGMGPGDLLAATGVAPTEGHVWGTKSSVTVTAGAYLKGYVTEIETVPLEVKNASDLSDLSGVKLIAFGR